MTSSVPIATNRRITACVFLAAFTHLYEAEYALLKPKDGMRLLDLGCGSGAAAYYLASRCNIEITCVTNSSVQADICRRKLAKLGGRGRVMVTDFDSLDLPSESFDAIYTLESIGYTKDLDAWLARCWWMLKPGGRLLIRSPGSLDHCRREEDYRASPLLRQLALQFCRRQPSRLQAAPTASTRSDIAGCRSGLGALPGTSSTPSAVEYRLKMRTFVELEQIIWRTSKLFVLATRTIPCSP